MSFIRKKKCIIKNYACPSKPLILLEATKIRIKLSGEKNLLFHGLIPKTHLWKSNCIINAFRTKRRARFWIFFLKVLQFDTEEVLVWYSYWKKDRNLTVKKQVRNYHKRLRETWWHKTEQKENWANALEYKHCDEPQKKKYQMAKCCGHFIKEKDL